MTDRLRVISLATRLAFRAGGWRIGAILVCNVALAVLPSANALALKELTNGTLDHDWNRAALALAGLGLLITVMFSAYGIFVPMKVTVSERATRLFEQDLMGLVLSIPTLEAHEHPDFADRLEVLRKNPQALVGFVWTGIANVSFFIGAGAALGLLMSADPLLLVLPLFGLPLLFASKRALSLRDQALDATAESSRLADHYFDVGTSSTYAKEVRIFGLGDEMSGRFRSISEVVNRKLHRAEVMSGLWMACAWALFIVAWTGAIALLAVHGVNGKASPGEVVLGIAVAGLVQGYVSGAIGMVREFGQSIAMAGRYVWLEKFARGTASGWARAPRRLEQGIELRSVSFSYPGAESEVLHEVSADLPAGATIAIVGENGAGKTTAVKLLLGMYLPSKGSVLIDQRADLVDINPEDWCAATSGVFQDFVKFEFLTREAIGFGDLPRLHNDSAIGRAIGRSNIDDFPDLAQQLGSRWEGGVELSEGQWQNLAVARGMMRDSPVLRVLDEPTASLDADAEHALFDRYSEAGRLSDNKVITILISHRFSTVRMADVILVFDKGSIVERGSHDALMEENGLYAELYQLQARGYSA